MKCKSVGTYKIFKTSLWGFGKLGLAFVMTFDRFIPSFQSFGGYINEKVTVSLLGTVGESSQRNDSASFVNICLRGAQSQRESMVPGSTAMKPLAGEEKPH